MGGGLDPRGAPALRASSQPGSGVQSRGRQLGEGVVCSAKGVWWLEWG